jgi:hypothetical protein
LILFLFVVGKCNQTLNLLERSEYFRLDTNIPNDQLNLTNLFTPPNSMTLIRSTPEVPTLTLTLIKGPVDLTSIQITGQSGEFNAFITTLANSTDKAETITIRSNQSVINQYLTQVSVIKLEFPDLPISTTNQSLQINLTTCERTLRKFSCDAKRPNHLTCELYF